ncbi:hypothetical protein MJM59_32865, partial [Salmonella enterica subsp. enterica serovar Montevideo]|nr:hypothetical protein [Salmonella enterica subsp. enterica serovar Montevideo]
TCGTIGTMLTFVVTGPIVAHSGPQAALLTANGLYAVVFVMCFPPASDEAALHPLAGGYSPA